MRPSPDCRCSISLPCIACDTGTSADPALPLLVPATTGGLPAATAVADSSADGRWPAGLPRSAASEPAAALCTLSLDCAAWRDMRRDWRDMAATRAEGHGLRGRRVPRAWRRGAKGSPQTPRKARDGINRAAEPCERGCVWQAQTVEDMNINCEQDGAR